MKKLPLLLLVPLVALGAYVLAAAPLRHDFFRFINQSEKSIWVEEVSGFDKKIPCGILAPRTSAGSSFMDAAVPEKTKIKWRYQDNAITDKSWHESGVELSALKPSDKTDVLIFEFLANETWTTYFKKAFNGD